ncbi:uncharacterized protein F4822DRAFT_428542 [Hypoxylon trugodes]|uniref:uncharacterized protein n=1 Tax=Hypoxylon trugodes TaxID=326681 RepID=UPI00218D7E3E|nr:uncharacterized protein F4822DRAFT_428542 [Hypoxylon trugodes]KAI1390200.1 hypothetical protein F4822DRAFT_428542 [Hypoxylon trugodes]
MARFLSTCTPIYQIAQSIILLCLLIKGVRGVTVHDVFNVKSGTTNGGCDGQNVDQWFSDSQTLIYSASTGAAATDTDNRKYLQTFFSIGPNDDAKQAGDPINRVKAILDGNAEPDGGKPWLFCSSDWLVEQKWTDIAYDATTGQLHSDGTKIEDVFPIKLNEVPFWSDDLRQYLSTVPGDYCKTTNDLAVTQDQTTPGTVTLCVPNFNSNQVNSLADIPAVTTQRTSISTLQAHSLSLFHEMFHLTLGVAQTPDAGYELNSVVRFGTKKAISNPESYTFYALAYYLGQRFPQYTFANSKSMNKPAAAGTKRSILDLGKSMLLPFQPAKKDLPDSSWVA